jgi:hypothetical protein
MRTLALMEKIFLLAIFIYVLLSPAGSKIFARLWTTVEA